jgi:aromatic ring-opening dioxygenase catalytic subunit (LigB family)
MPGGFRSLYLSHGGGPLPLLGDARHQEMVACLRTIAGLVPKPAAIVVVSAHWEEDILAITAGPSPPLIYDYYGFPEESYAITYPCAGEPALAQRLQGLLADAGIGSALDARRGFDHGLFVPLKIMYPEADIPCVQLSLARPLDPATHIGIGRALRPLAADNVLLIGSGFSFHNMREFFGTGTPQAPELNAAFEAWLLDTCGATDRPETERRQALIRWAEAPGARFCHPREEHLLPLHVCYGAAGQACVRSFALDIMGKRASVYLW